MFPGPNATIYRNEAGEVLGWDNGSPEDDANAYYCDQCGINHVGRCWSDDEDDDEELIESIDDRPASGDRE